MATALGRIEAHELWVVVPFLVFGLTSARATCRPPSFWRRLRHRCGALRARDAALDPGPARLNLVIGAALIIGALRLPRRLRRGSTKIVFRSRRQRHLTAGHVWHDDATGGYLIYANRLPVFIDDRAELYGAEFFREFVDTRRGTPTWRIAFDRYGIEQVLVRTDAGLAEVLAEEGWNVDFADDQWTVFSNVKST